MAAEQTPPPPAAPQEGAGGRKKMWVLVLVAVLIVAALGTAAFFLLSKGPTPAAPTLNRVTLTTQPGTTVDQGQGFVVTAAAVDTDGVVQTSNSTITWIATPTGVLQLAATGANNRTVVALAYQGGIVNLTATAVWKGSSRSGSVVLTSRALHFEVTSNNFHPQQGLADLLYIRATRADGSTATTYTGSVSLTSTDPNAFFNGSTAFSAANQGNVSLFVTLYQGGPVTITATDLLFPITGSGTLNVNLPPVAAFTITPNTSDPRIVTVDGSTSTAPEAGQTLTYLWIFGDGNTGTGVAATHTYSSAGSYQITLTVTDNYGAANSTTKSYTAHSPPTANFVVANESANGPNFIQVWLNGSTSTGGDGTITAYNWTWGDGTQSETTVPTASHNYSITYNNQQVTITLRVTNSYSLTNSFSRQVIVTAAALPPIASFTLSIDNTTGIASVDASASRSPIGRQILYYVWDWGDTSSVENLTVATATHRYLANGNFTVNLTVVDSGGLHGYLDKNAWVLVPPLPPIAIFNLTRTQLHVDVDASLSWDPNNNIATYAWDWGDSQTTAASASPLASHDYAAAGLYPVTLTVRDTTGRTGTAVRYASVAPQTLDYTFYDFLTVPYGEWWDYRYSAYGDLPINAACFNATSIADGACTRGTTYETGPYYTDWYPAPTGALRYFQNGNVPFIYGPYRFDVTGYNVAGYNLSEPVFLPVLNYNAPRGNSLSFDWNMQYLDVATANALIAAGCPTTIQPKFFDGFMIRSRVYLTMDYLEARRIFGVSTSANTLTTIRNWWSTNTNPSCGTSAALETNLGTWFATEGNGKYDIWNSYQYPYTPLYTNISYVIDNDASFTTHVAIDMAAWGTEALLARQFYWGNASYAANYLDSTKAKGWWGMELAWFEDFHFGGTLGTSTTNFNLTSVMQYHFQQLSSPGANTVYDRVDDVPYWTWGPFLSDYVPRSNQHTISELSRYTGLNYIHTTPGAQDYAVNESFDYVPTAWNAKAGEVWHFDFPAGRVPFYDPNNSTLSGNPASQLVTFLQYANYWKTVTPNYGVWNATQWTWDVYGGGTYSWPLGKSGSYAYVPYGAILLKPLGSNPGRLPTMGTAAQSFMISAAAASTLSASPTPASMTSTGTWSATAMAAPAPSGPAFSRSRV